MHGRPHPTQQACGRQRARTPTPSKCCPSGAANNPRGGGKAAAPRRCIELPRLRRAAVGNIAREHSPQRGSLAGDCATSVGCDGTDAEARRARPALAHRQRCRTQSRDRSGLRERRRQRCSAGCHHCDAHTPRQCARSALVPFCHSQASPRPRPCVVAWIQAVVGGVPALLTGGGGTVIRSPLAGQKATEGADNSLRAACVLPISADRSGVFHFPGASQAAVRKGGVGHRSVRAAGSGCKMAQKCMQHTPGTGPCQANNRGWPSQAHTA
ncbi:hypothetical protein ECC02_006927 [Trypanosoma cruzi]|uniref:Uncharacterized protein n=1 Tax=Trypanosoma cruzi TaxID=5693 RepID=A0A7J6Y0D2_TRYCR|nr:hypothetical protein ECC02_006927 [Trypanosoma cruzi]